MRPYVTRRQNELVMEASRAFPQSLPCGHVLCAVSGGSDSVALLEIMSLLRDRYDLTVSAACIDHGVRKAAATELEHVRRLARERDVPFYESRVENPERDDEAYLRELRYAHLDRIARRINADWLATGHTRDDQIETILFRMFRGAGRRGMSGIALCDRGLVRPLLRAGREQLRDFLRSRGVAWCEDESNDDPAYTRNRIRHELRPTIEKTLGTAGVARLPLLAERWRDEEAYLEQQAGRWRAYAVRDSTEHGSYVDIVALDEAPAALRARVLRAWLRDVCGGAEPGIAGLEALETLLAEPGEDRRIDIGGICALTRGGRLTAQAAETAASFVERRLLTDSVDIVVGPGSRWTLRVDPAPEGPRAQLQAPWAEEVDIDRGALDGGLEIRCAAADDAIQTPDSGRIGVPDFLSRMGVPYEAAQAWPVLVRASSLLWVPGAGAAQFQGGTSAGTSGTPVVRFTWRRTRC